MAERKEKEKRRGRNHNNNNKEEGQRKKKEKFPHVRLSSKVDEFFISGDGSDDAAADGAGGGGFGGESEESTITLTKSEERFRKYMRESEDERNEKLAIEKGWCTNDGIPWSRNQMPKDEAALLKQGVVDRSGTRSTYFSLNTDKYDKFSTGYPKFYDEIELLKEGLVNKNGHQKVSGSEVKKEMKNGNAKHSYEPIDIAELNSRGFVDQNGQLYYGNIPCLYPPERKTKHSKKSKERKEKKKKESAKSPRVQLCESHESCTILKTPVSSTSDFYAKDDADSGGSETRVSFSPNRKYSVSDSKNKSKKHRKSKELAASQTSTNAADGGFGMIQCEAGHGNDAGTIKYAVTKDGRNYELNTNDGHYLQLEFNKKHAYLIID